MFFDWIGRDGGALLSWWLLALVAAIAVYPLLFRLLRGLPGRGLALAPAAGLMLIGFVFWMLNILGLVDNSPGSTLLAAIIVFVVGVVSYVTWQEHEPLLPWLRDHWSLIVAAELLFTVLFLAWATVRAMNPSLVATEKPMEMAFLSAIRRSETFPPHDPWMSGYAISYYHFGYIIMGMLGNVSGVTNGVAFNLALPLLFALTGTGAFGIAYELVAAHVEHHHQKHKGVPPRHHPQALGVGLLAAVFTVIMGNLGTVAVELPYQTCTASPAYLRFMDLEERDSYPPAVAGGSPCGSTGSVDPTVWNYWWWFRYSRVVRDNDLNGSPIGVQPITEMPIFSFVLSDMHPHVLALPFAMLAICLGFNLVMLRRELQPWEMILYAIFVGGMVFLNSWDAVYLGLIIGAEALRRLITNGTGAFARADLFGLVRFAVTLAVLTGLLYLPFFISFRSQAGGILPNVIWPTQWQQFLLMFGPFVLIIALFLYVEMRRAGASFNWAFAQQTIGTGIALLAVAFVVLATVAWFNPDIRQAAFQVVDESGGILALIIPVIVRRLSGVPTEALLALALFVVIGRLFAREPRDEDGTPAATDTILTYSPATGYVLLLIAAGAVLTLAPDFVYLHDNFGVRINTIFKLYYQGWLLWSVAGAFAFWSVLFDRAGEPERELIPPLRRVFGIVSVALIALCLVYPVFAIYSRAYAEAGRRNAPQNTALTLEGGPSLASGNDDYQAIECLSTVAKSDQDVVAEATKAHIAYNVEDVFSRVSGLTGIPTLIGWDNHEMQWRGTTFDAANTYTDPGGKFTETRADAIAKLYNSTKMADAATIIKRYGITYIYVGPTERHLFTAAGLAKFNDLPPVCTSGDVHVYAANSITSQTNALAGG